MYLSIRRPTISKNIKDTNISNIRFSSENIKQEKRIPFAAKTYKTN